MFDWLVSMVEQGGYLGIAFLMFAENVFPPIPSELIMPLGGYLAYDGKLNIVLAIVAGTVGSVAGTSLWYFAACRLTRDRAFYFVDRYGRWLTISRDGLKRAEAWFDRHAGAAVFFGRMIPAIRTLISVPAGFAGMSLARFLLLSTAGSVLWTSFLTFAGYLLGSQYEKVADWMNPVTNAIFIGIVALFVVRQLRGKGRRPADTG